MRPWADAGSDGPRVAALPLEGAAGGGWSGDFLRGGNLFSVAALQALEIHAEARFHHFAALASTRVAEDKVIRDRLIHRRGKIEVHRLIVGRFHGEQGLARAVAGRVGLLLLVQDKEVDVRGFVGCPVHLPDERFEDSMKMRPDSMGGNFKRESSRRFQAESLL